MMIGDGINDAPCLSQANIGVSFIEATNIIILASDSILLNADLEKIPEFIDISKKIIKKLNKIYFGRFFIIL